MLDLKKFTFINCICCGYKIELSHRGLTDDEIFQDLENYRPDDQMWNNGALEVVRPGYGSSNDGDVFYLGICDTCIDNGYKNGRLRYRGDYMDPNYFKFDESELKKQEEKRNRENNLNDLLS